MPRVAWRPHCSTCVSLYGLSPPSFEPGCLVIIACLQQVLLEGAKEGGAPHPSWSPVVLERRTHPGWTQVAQKDLCSIYPALTRQHFVREGVPGSLGSMCLFHTCFCSKQSSPRAADCPPETRSLTKPEAYLWARLAGFTYLCSSALITSVWPGPAFVWLLGI